MNCDRIAPLYERIEKAAFGDRLQRHRLMYLSAAQGKRRALILGDGDGRFSAALRQAFPDLAVDSVELSRGMRDVAAQRGVPMIEGDARTYPFARRCYDIVFTHFFLDCFTAEEARNVVRRVAQALEKNAIWIVSDFRQVESGWQRLYTLAWLRIMYFFFRLATGLETQQLPSYGTALEAEGFRLRKDQVSGFGLIASEWWQR